MLPGTGGHYLALVKEERSCAASMAPIGPDRELKPWPALSDYLADVGEDRRRSLSSGAQIHAAVASPRPICAERSLASPRIMRLRLGPRPSRRIAYAMLLGEGLAARSAEFGLDRLN